MYYHLHNFSIVVGYGSMKQVGPGNHVIVYKDAPQRNIGIVCYHYLPQVCWDLLTMNVVHRKVGSCFTHTVKMRALLHNFTHTLTKGSMLHENLRIGASIYLERSGLLHLAKDISSVLKLE